MVRVKRVMRVMLLVAAGDLGLRAACRTKFGAGLARWEGPTPAVRGEILWMFVAFMGSLRFPENGSEI
jgi:hypothetical protein